MKKPSEIFEGKNSSLRKTFDMTNDIEWEVEFEKILDDGGGDGEWHMVQKSQLKDFIKSLLTSQAEEMERKIKELPEQEPQYESNDYDRGLADMKLKVLAIIKNK